MIPIAGNSFSRQLFQGVKALVIFFFFNDKIHASGCCKINCNFNELNIFLNYLTNKWQKITISCISIETVLWRTDTSCYTCHFSLFTHKETCDKSFIFYHVSKSSHAGKVCRWTPVVFIWQLEMKNINYRNEHYIMRF